MYLLKKYSDPIFILAVFLFQMIFIFQGLDFADQGQYATTYLYIFSSPESVKFFFMYWLSLVAGGAWLQIFPDLGLLGIRFAGVLTTTITLTIVYYGFKNYISKKSLRFGILIGVFLLIRIHQSYTMIIFPYYSGF